MATLLSSLTRQVRRSGANPTRKSAWWTNWNWSRSSTGAQISDETAVGLATFYRGVKLISATIAAFPFHVYEEATDDNAPSKVTSADTYYLRGRPNPEMVRHAMWTRIVADVVRGNGFIWVEKNDIGGVANIYHLERQRVKVGRMDDGRKIYQLDNELPMIDYKEGGEIIHIPNWGDSLVGYDIVKVANDAIALGISAQEYAARFFTQNGVPPGLISTEQELTRAQAKELSDYWHEVGPGDGPTNWHKARVLGRGAKFQATGVDPEKMQLEPLRKFQAGEIATLLGIPPHMLGLVDRTTSWGSGIAELTQGFQMFTLIDPVRLVEQSVDDALLVRELTGRYLKLDMDGLLRGTTLQRYQGYALGYGRWLSTNDIRRDEDMPPVDGGDNVLAAVNMVPLEQLGAMMQEQNARQLMEAVSRMLLPAPKAA